MLACKYEAAPVAPNMNTLASVAVIQAPDARGL